MRPRVINLCPDPHSVKQSEAIPVGYGIARPSINGTYKRVPQMVNQFNEGDNARITVYYTSPEPTLTTAFRPTHPTTKAMSPIRLVGPTMFASVGAKCPASYPIKTPQVMYEVNWDTAHFINEPWPTDGTQPFVLSTGDT
ncbi:hypothetical protein B0H66DRAFT_536495 [Apodospora peruviana]|uniref:DUF1996 domain-containing protein n=1 Tax=Apodospora peruviana TaxID=516989 RepID=A0AAE0M1G7_9PEZI|nr:hypothetical protein B0H66DRAFT_536495 [Apodospora peruviana]